MYSKKDFLKAMGHEVRILKHLYEKIEEEDLRHQFTDKQRTIHELLQYLSIMIQYMSQGILTGSSDHFSTFQEDMSAVDIKQFPKHLDDQLAYVKESLATISDEDLQEEVTMFGRYTNRKIVHLVQMVYAQTVAYKMQLFLQLKHAGKTHLVSSNLWMGMDPEPKN